MQSGSGRRLFGAASSDAPATRQALLAGSIDVCRGFPTPAVVALDPSDARHPSDDARGWVGERRYLLLRGPEDALQLAAGRSTRWRLDPLVVLLRPGSRPGANSHPRLAFGATAAAVWWLQNPPDAAAGAGWHPAARKDAPRSPWCVGGLAALASPAPRPPQAPELASPTAERRARKRLDPCGGHDRRVHGGGLWCLSSRRALAPCRPGGIAAADAAGLATFTTDDPLVTIGAAVSRPPSPSGGCRRSKRGRLQRREVFADHCGLSDDDDPDAGPSAGHAAPLCCPVVAGGRWQRSAGGSAPDGSNFWLTVPRRPMPAAGYPTVVLCAPGGGDRPAYRSRHAHHTTGPTDGRQWTGAAFGPRRLCCAERRWSAGGLRNPDARDEQFPIFNILNSDGAGAITCGNRQIEIAAASAYASDLIVDTGDCLRPPPAASWMWASWR